MALMDDDGLWWIPQLQTRSEIHQQHQQNLKLRADSSDIGGVLVPFHAHERANPWLHLANAVNSNADASSSSSTSDAPAMARPTGFVFSKGLGFAGQVFGLYSRSRSCLVGVEEKRFLKNIPFACSFVKRFLSKMFHTDANSKGPAFNFFISQDDAKAYLKQLKVPDMEIGSVPLHLAYKFFKERPTLFSFIPAKKQVEIAKNMIKRAQGGNVARQFKGVPVFSSENLSILVVSPNGARWFRPYFFKKEELDGVLKSSMEHHYQSIIRSRSARRHNQIGDLPSDMGEDDLEMLESQDMQEFMEDMDEWDSILDSIMAKAAQLYVQDALDKAIFGNKWCRMVAGIQPKFPILVDSFEHRATMDYMETENRLEKATGGDSKRGWLFSKLGKFNKEQLQGEDSELKKTPHLTVVAGIAGSSADQVIKAASSAIQEAKDKMEKNQMPLENLFIADLGGPQMWSNPISGLGDDKETTS